MVTLIKQIILSWAATLHAFDRGLTTEHLALIEMDHERGHRRE